MIALDTNFIVRMLVGDDPRQTRRARALVDRALADGASLFVSTVVLCETVWVLASGYGASRETLVEALVWLLSAEQLTIEDHDDAERALRAFAAGRGDFSDYLIRERAIRRGSAAVATFDRKLLKEDGFVDPDPSKWDEDVSLHEPRPRYGRRRRRARRAVTR
jgi:predicted nucleic-acid-binding protein